MSALSRFDWYRGSLEWLPRRTIFLTKHGSHAYGTSLPTSDLDLKGIAIAPKEYYLGVLQSFEQAEVRDPLDVVIFDIRKFFKLAWDCNPNIVEILHTDPNDWIETDLAYNERESHEGNFRKTSWGRIYDNRHLFLSRKAQHTFSGYAVAQFKRIKTHRAYLLNPPKAAPVRTDYGLPEGQPTVGKEQLGLINSRVRKLEDAAGGSGLTKDVLEAADEELVTTALSQMNLARDLIPIILAERRYASACKAWQQYQTHLQERNATRAELEAKFGYDTKHAMHLVRLLRMAKEILGRGEVLVKRPDAEELLAIRAGAWSYDQLAEWATQAEAELVGVAANSPLPHSPDRKKLDEILVSIIERML